MKIIGTIMEVNPFHNGHQYFLNNIKKNIDDILVVIISTSIVQRGEVSVLNKQVKTKLLLDNNVDIVIELPSIYANQGGYYFAKHAIRHLNMLNVDTLVFGSESNDLNMLKDYALNYEASDFKKGIYNNLNEISSNDILGVSYIKACSDLKLDLDLKLVKRISNDYNDNNISNTNTIASATSIRNNIDNRDLIKNTLPKYSLDNMKKVDEEKLYEIFKVCLLNCSNNIFLSENNELINKFKKYINKDYKDFINSCKDKNNSKYKIKRVMINVILDVDSNKYSEDIKYIRLLGFSKFGQLYLNKLKNKYIITNLKKNESYSAIIEIRATNLFNTVTSSNINYDLEKPIIGE